MVLGLEGVHPVAVDDVVDVEAVETQIRDDGT